MDAVEFRARVRLKCDMATAVVDAYESMALACIAFAEQRYDDGAEDLLDAAWAIAFVAQAGAVLGEGVDP